jgi:hypothetical protein
VPTVLRTMRLSNISTIAGAKEIALLRRALCASRLCIAMISQEM